MEIFTMRRLTWASARKTFLMLLIVASVAIASDGNAQSVIELTGTVSASSLTSQINGKPAGPVTVRSAAGQTATVTGDFQFPRAAVTVSNVTFTDALQFGPGDNGCQLLNSRAQGFYIFGADDIVLRGNYFDGLGQMDNNLIYDQPAGSFPERFTIENNTFRRYYGDPQDHSEALYIGYSADGLVQGNVFDDNGSTAHVFFTWFGNTANPSTSYPRRICVRNNTWGPTHPAYFDVNFREEIPVSSGIAIDPAQGASSTHPAFTRACATPGPPAPPVLLP
jgi:hypothetical protein